MSDTTYVASAKVEKLVAGFLQMRISANNLTLALYRISAAATAVNVSTGKIVGVLKSFKSTAAPVAAAGRAITVTSEAAGDFSDILAQLSKNFNTTVEQGLKPFASIAGTLDSQIGKLVIIR